MSKQTVDTFSYGPSARSLIEANGFGVVGTDAKEIVSSLLYFHVNNLLSEHVGKTRTGRIQKKSIRTSAQSCVCEDQELLKECMDQAEAAEAKFKASRS